MYNNLGQTLTTLYKFAHFSSICPSQEPLRLLQLEARVLVKTWKTQEYKLAKQWTSPYDILLTTWE